MHPQRSQKENVPSVQDFDLYAVYKKLGSTLVVSANPPQFTMLAASDQYLEIVNLKEDDVVGKGVFEVFPGKPGEAESILLTFQRVIEQKEPIELPTVKYSVLEGDSARE